LFIGPFRFPPLFVIALPLFLFKVSGEVLALKTPPSLSLVRLGALASSQSFSLVLPLSSRPPDCSFFFKPTFFSPPPPPPFQTPTPPPTPGLRPLSHPTTRPTPPVAAQQRVSERPSPFPPRPCLELPPEFLFQATDAGGPAFSRFLLSRTPTRTNRPMLHFNPSPKKHFLFPISPFPPPLWRSLARFLSATLLSRPACFSFFAHGVRSFPF